MRRPACLCHGRARGRGQAGAARDRRLVRRDAGRARGTRRSAVSGFNTPGTLWRRTATHLERDFVALTRNGLSTTIPANLALVGPPDRLWIDETARVDPYTVFDTTNGPIMVGRRAWIQPFTRVEGPCFIGAETQLFRANIRESRLDRPQLPDRRRGRGVDRARLFEQVSRGVPRSRLRRRVGQPGGDHLQQRPAERLRRGFRSPPGRPGQDRPDQGRLLHRRPHPHRTWAPCSTRGRRSA